MGQMNRMNQWNYSIQYLIGEIDLSIRSGHDAELCLRSLSKKMGYSKFYVSHKFTEIAGMSLRKYLRSRKLALSCRKLRDSDSGILDIALEYGFSSHEAYTRAFKETYGITPSQYRETRMPLVLRTILRPFDCYLLENGGYSMNETKSEVKVYFITLEKHKFLHIRNYESIGYWDFWKKQESVPGQDCETITGILSGMGKNLDGIGGVESDASSGQLMAFINNERGRICSWGIPLAEAYGIRLPADYSGPVPDQMQLMDVDEGEYIVFEHGPFDFEKENGAVEEKIEQAMKDFDYKSSGYVLDMTPERVFYFYHDCNRFWKYVRPVKRV